MNKSESNVTPIFFMQTAAQSNAYRDSGNGFYRKVAGEYGRTLNDAEKTESYEARQRAVEDFDNNRANREETFLAHVSWELQTLELFHALDHTTEKLN